MTDAHNSPKDTITPQHAAAVEGQHGLAPGSVWGLFQNILSLAGNPAFWTAIQNLVSLFKSGKSATVTEVPK